MDPVAQIAIKGLLVGLAETGVAKPAQMAAILQAIEDIATNEEATNPEVTVSIGALVADVRQLIREHSE